MILWLFAGNKNEVKSVILQVESEIRQRIDGIQSCARFRWSPAQVENNKMKITGGLEE